MLLQGKRIAIFNMANKRSIAWSIAKSMDAQGASLILG
ncbi:MAG TPA: NADH-specific enoyl-ACP reductase, partial [Firmicutes bacterium]|nr:NADH-specific enoyl-ACP reductase [Bacillota bacterium]